MSGDNWDEDYETPEERAYRFSRLLYDKYLADAKSAEAKSRAIALESSERYRRAVKLVGALSSNRHVKLELLRAVHHDNLHAAISRYMAKERLPNEYAALVERPECIQTLVEGIFYRVCKLKTSPALTDPIIALSNAMRQNLNRLTAYDRVGLVQQFIHQQVDHAMGLGAARAIPVEPMKNALSAARLHLGVADLLHGSPAYILFMNSSSAAARQHEYDDPRSSTASYGKHSWSRWRVRHLQPLSYFFQPAERRLLVALEGLSESLEKGKFMEESLQLYATYEDS